MRKDPKTGKLSREKAKAVNDRISEAELEKMKKQEIIERYKKLEEENELLLEGIKKDVEKRIKEIEKDKELSLEDKKKLLEEVRKEYRQDIENIIKANETLRENTVKFRQENDKLKSELANLGELKKDDEKLLKKLERDMTVYREVLGKATSADNLIKRFECVRDDLQVAKELIVERGYTKEEFGEERIAKITEIITRIRETLSETEEFIGQIPDLSE